nr:hypothetical protein Iba_chr15aCG11710 [Ipomoea batatas]
MPPVTGIAQAADFTIGYSSNHRRAKEGEANIIANFTIGHHSNNLRDHHSPQQLLPMSQPPTINGGQTQPMSPPPMGPSTAAPPPRRQPSRLTNHHQFSSDPPSSSALQRPRLPLLPEPSLAPVSFSLKNGGTGEENNETVVMAWHNGIKPCIFEKSSVAVFPFQCKRSAGFLMSVNEGDKRSWPCSTGQDMARTRNRKLLFSVITSPFNSNDDAGDVRSSPLLIMLSPTTARAKR